MVGTMNVPGGGGSSKLPPIPCNGWCYTESEEDIVYDYAWTIERFSRAAVNFRTGELGTSSENLYQYCYATHIPPIWCTLSDQINSIHHIKHISGQP